MANVTRPLLHYYGGKWALAAWIIQYFPSHKVYVEPFGGGASLLLKKLRSEVEIYNDLNGEIVNLFRQVRDNGEELCRLLRATPYAREEFKLSYEPCPDNPLEQARRTIVRANLSFGTYGAAKNTAAEDETRLTGFSSSKTKWWKSYPPALEAAIERLQGVNIENMDALKLIDMRDGKDTFFYVDPPYVHSTRDEPKAYEYEMTDKEHRVLAEKLNKVKGKVILSGYPCPLYEELYKGWEKVEKEIGCERPKKRVEALWFRNCEEGLI